MLAKRADEILGQLVALIDISAYLAYPALLAVCFGLWLDIVLIVSIGHCFLVGDNSCFGNAANKHTVSVKVDVAFYLERHEGVYILRQENKPVVGTQRFTVCKFVRINLCYKD